MEDISGNSGRTRPRLAWLREWGSRLAAGFGFAVVAGVTGRISYIHIQALSLALHQPPDVARLMPFGVDGLVVVGSVALLQAPRSQEWLGWICVGPGAAVSLFANVMSAWANGPLAAAWAGVASMSFIASTYTFERWVKAQFGDGSQGGSEPAGSAAETLFQGSPDGGAPVMPHPLTTSEALQALLDSDSERNLAFAMGVDRNRVVAWKRRLDAADEDAAVPSLNGDGAHG